MFVVAGESLMDLVAGPNASLTAVPGGGPYNFARALALQGVPAGYANPLSEDAFGSVLRDSLKASGARHLGRTSALPTSLAVVTSDERGRPRYSFYRQGVADRDIDAATLLATLPESTIGFHTGGLALVPPDNAAMLETIRAVRARGALCTVDANMRPQVARTLGIDASRYREAALEVLGAAHIAKVSDEDLQHLGFSGAPQIAARALLHLGCRLVVLTLGGDGAWAIGAEEQVFHRAAPIDPLDTVGAGDCFFAGFVAALHRNDNLNSVRDRAPPVATLSQALRHASACAAINIGRIGCAPPSWEEAVAWQEFD